MSLILFYIISLVNFVSKSVTEKSLRIIGGRDALVNEFPYAVQLLDIYNSTSKNSNGDVVKIQTMYYTTCTGCALSATWTLTAFHCVSQNGYLTDLYIRYGYSKGKPSKSDLFSKVYDMEYLKRSFMWAGVGDDVALLFTQPVLLQKFAKISAIDYRALYGQKVTIVGFGIANTSQGYYDDTHGLKMPLQASDSFMLKSCNYDDVYPSMCLVPACGKRYSMPCCGDSGAPIIHPTGIVAVQTSGYPCYISEHVGMNDCNVVTSLSPYIDWIEKVISEKTPSSN